jgi:peptide/nickel transport system ATP-binding protein
VNGHPVIRAEQLCIDYRLGKKWLNAIQDVSLSIDPLSIHGLVGESGSGKTTLALALMRFVAANARIASGQILLDGDDLSTKSHAQLRRIWGKDISLVPQDSLASLNPSYSIGEQIAEITRYHEGLSSADAWARAVEMLARVRIADPEAVARRYPHQLSGGMQQRVTIAMALSTKPRLLILDEPTTALDVTTQAVILDLFRDLIRDNEAAALYVSHDLGIVAQLCDYVTVLYGGEVMATGPVREIYRNPLHPYTIGLLASLPRYVPGVETRLPTIAGSAPSLEDRPKGCVFAPRCPVALQKCFDEKPPLEQIAHQRLIKCHRWREIADGTLELQTEPVEQQSSPAPRDGLALTVSGLSKQFDESTLFDRLLGSPRQAVQAVDKVSLTINQRATLGLVGESGSGKTTLARCILALITAEEGEMSLLEMPLSLDLSQRTREVFRHLQIVFQNPNDALNPYHSVGQALQRTLKRLSKESLSQGQIEARVFELLEAVRLTPDYATRYPAELSGGEKQRVAIARAFATNPALIVADEPTSALDVSVQSVVLNLLKDLRAQHGVSYLLISHNLDVITYLADWIAVMYLGEIVELGDASDVYDAPSHPYTEALVSARPVADPTIQQKQIRLEGEVPSARQIPSGCRFHTRCPRKIGAICEQDAPPWRDAGDGHYIRCHIPIDELIALQRNEPIGEATP